LLDGAITALVATGDIDLVPNPQVKTAAVVFRLLEKNLTSRI